MVGHVKDTPNFAAWDTNTLAKFSEDAYVRMQEQSEAIEQLRQDLRTAMNELRAATLNKDDWK